MTEYTLSQAGALIGRSRSTLQNQVRRGVLRARLVGKTYVVTTDELIRYAHEHRHPPSNVSIEFHEWTEAELREAFGK